MLMIVGTIKPVEIKTFKLDNGLRVFVVEDHSSPVATVQVWYRVGSRNENYGITGISHLLEHMMFRPSKGIKGDYSQIIDMMGGSDNAFTTRDATAYHVVIPSNRVEEVLAMEADRMRNLTFEGFEEEREVVKEERRWRTENTPNGTVYEALYAISFIAHPYRHPVIGWMSDLNSITLEDVKRYYDTYYAPNNAAVIVVGDVKAEEIYEMVKKYFGKYEPRKIPEVGTREPEQRGIRRATVKKEGFSKILAISWHIPEGKNDDIYALEVLSSYLNSKTSKLYKDLIEGGKASSYFVWVAEGIDPSIMVFWVNLQPNSDFSEVERIILKNLAEIKEKGIDEAFLNRVKKSAIVEFVNGTENVLGLGMRMGWSWIIHGDPGKINDYPRKISEVKVEDIKRVANAYLKEDAYNAVQLEPIPPKDPQKFLEAMKKAQEIKR
jgi:zinc protease